MCGGRPKTRSPWVGIRDSMLCRERTVIGMTVHAQRHVSALLSDQPA
jgi:hypothetical protein